MLAQCTFVMSRWTSRLPLFARRAFHVDQMEMDSALSQMYSLCLTPSLVSKMSRARKMTKGHYYRDDPAFLVLQLAFLIVAAVARWLTLGMMESLLGLLVRAVVAYALWGLVMACVWRAVAVLCLSVPTSTMPGAAHGAGSAGVASAPGADPIADYLRPDLDWRYAFDVHCNGYFTFFMWTEVLLCMVAPLAARAWLTNAFVAVGATTYLYNVFLGYLEIPSLSHQQRLLYPVLVVAALYVFLSLCDVNVGVPVVFGWCS
ncbi:unc-50-like protein [Novymonas esmeraldas]|uniref:Unc-50-like protein n=1 Tax=Novymonas esmeraldas TaxID=1808958 RepID=A0AAW0EYQ1_9TRYP